MRKRRLGRSNIEVSAIGLGCWAIGGPFKRNDTETVQQMGWGKVDDAESIRAIHCAIDLGVNLFDTASNYGAGHSERVLGRALAGRRDGVVIATKFGSTFDEAARMHTGGNASPAFIRQSCEDSLRRLGTDIIDLFQFHIGDYPIDQVGEVLKVLEDLVAAGKIRWYGWSTDEPERAHSFAQGEHCAAIQHRLSWVYDAPEMLAVCEQYDLASLNRHPLNSGLLTGKFTPDTTFPEDDGRYGVNFREGLGAERLRQIEAARQAFAQEGRTLAQVALAWILARSDRTLPIPGFKTVQQVQENVGTLDQPVLREEQVRLLDEIAGRAVH